MKDSELQIDRSCHVLYSKPCKKEIEREAERLIREGVIQIE